MVQVVFICWLWWVKKRVSVEVNYSIVRFSTGEIQILYFVCNRRLIVTYLASILLFCLNRQQDMTIHIGGYPSYSTLGSEYHITIPSSLTRGGELVPQVSVSISTPRAFHHFATRVVHPQIPNIRILIC